MIIRDGGTTNVPPGVPMSMSPEYPLDGGELHFLVTFSFQFIKLERGDLFWSASVRIRDLAPSFFHRTVFTFFSGKSFADTVGPMATITDSLFSLIIFIYVMVA